MVWRQICTNEQNASSRRCRPTAALLLKKDPPLLPEHEGRLSGHEGKVNNSCGAGTPNSSPICSLSDLLSGSASNTKKLHG